MLTRRSIPPPKPPFPADGWRVVEARWSPEFAGRAEAGLAQPNGYVGVRGTRDKGRPALAPGVFVNGFHKVLKQVNAVMAMFLLGNEFSLEQMRLTIDSRLPGRWRPLGEPP